MDTEKNIKIEIDSKTIEAISSLCCLSGLDAPGVINVDFIETANKRIKEILLSLKGQSEENNKQIEDLKKQVLDLKKHIEELKKSYDSTKSTEEHRKTETGTTEKTSDSTGEPRIPGKIQNILIIANLGVIMHQLKILFNKSGCKVTLVKSYTEAIGELKLQPYECILFDMPGTHENDLALIEALRKATEICHTETLILVLIVPSKDKKLIQKIKTKGANIIIEKHESWHMNILKELKLVPEESYA